MFKNEPKPHNVENWTCVFNTNKSFEAEMLKNYFADHEIPCNILSKKDSAYVVDHSSLSILFVYVPESFEAEARKLIEELENREEDLTSDAE
jgi:hypothetical protein